MQDAIEVTLEDLDLCWGDNIQVDIKEIEWQAMDCICQVQDRDMRLAVVNMVMNFWLHIMRGISWLAKELSSYQEGLFSL